MIHLNPISQRGGERPDQFCREENFLNSDRAPRKELSLSSCPGNCGMIPPRLVAASAFRPRLRVRAGWRTLGEKGERTVPTFVRRRWPSVLWRPIWPQAAKAWNCGKYDGWGTRIRT